MLAHQPFNPLLADALASFGEIAMHIATAIRASRCQIGFFDVHEQSRVFFLHAPTSVASTMRSNRCARL
jgi:hypothetical protein